MFSRTLMLAAAALAISALAANAETSTNPSSSNPSMQPNPGGATKAEEPGTKAGAKKKGAKKKADDPSQSSSTPSMAPTPGAGTTGKIESEGKNTAKVKGKKKQATPGNQYDQTDPHSAPYPHFNGVEINFYRNSAKQQTAACHELGHALGLNHRPDIGLTNRFTIDPSITSLHKFHDGE